MSESQQAPQMPPVGVAAATQPTITSSTFSQPSPASSATPEPPRKPYLRRIK
jgi:hypothetical protein